MSDCLAQRVGLVGCGNMGFALLQGWLRMGIVSADRVTVVEPSEALRARASALGVRAVAGRQDFGPAPDVLILAIKPQHLIACLKDYADLARTATFVSVAAGITIARMRQELGDAAIVRVMPNTPAAIGRGTLGYFATAGVDAARKAAVVALLTAVGSVHEVGTESEIDSVTAVSGSGPAYVFAFIEALARAGEGLGLDKSLALALARDTVIGASALIDQTGANPADLRREVTSPNGTTEAGLRVFFQEDRLQALMNEVVQAAARRSVELSTA